MMTGALVDAPLYRPPIEPDAANDLTAPSQAMVDNTVALPRAKCRRVVGRISEASPIALSHTRSVMIGRVDRPPWPRAEAARAPRRISLSRFRAGARMSAASAAGSRGASRQSPARRQA